MSNLTIKVERKGNQIIVSGTFLTGSTVTLTVNGTSVAVTTSGNTYTSGLIGPFSPNPTISVSAGAKSSSGTQLDPDVKEFSIGATTGNLVHAKALRTNSTTIKVSGKFATGNNPQTARCTQLVANRVINASVDSNSLEWDAVFDNNSGSGHQFTVEF